MVARKPRRTAIATPAITSSNQSDDTHEEEAERLEGKKGGESASQLIDARIDELSDGVRDLDEALAVAASAPLRMMFWRSLRRSLRGRRSIHGHYTT